MRGGMKAGSLHRWAQGIDCEPTGDPYVDLVLSLFRRTLVDIRKGDEEAVDWWTSDDGACLWLRALGIGIRPSMRARFEELALDKSYKV